MSNSSPLANSEHAPSPRFATTHWSMVLAAGDRALPQCQEALTSLCQTYWYPLYAFVRRLGQTAHDAQDLTQEFFAQVLAKDYLQAADPNRGRFRSFLLTSMQHFMSNERDRANSQKRGGGQRIVSLDFDQAESRLTNEPSHELTAEKAFERQWALTLLDRVLTRLRNEYTLAGKVRQFDALKIFLTGEPADTSQADIAKALDVSPGAVKVTVHRLRRRYRELLREEISQTVAVPDDIDDEINQLFAALA